MVKRSILRDWRGNIKLGMIIRKDISQLLMIIFAFSLMVLVSYIFVSRIVEKEIFSNVEGILHTAEAVLRADLREAEAALLNTAFFVSKGLEKGEAIDQYIICPIPGSQVPGLVSLYAYINGEFIFCVPWQPPADWSPEGTVWYATARQTDKEISYTLPYTDAYSGRTVISLIKNLYNHDGEKCGILGLNVDFSIISEYVKALQSFKQGYGMLLDESYRFLVHPIDKHLYEPIEAINPGLSQMIAGFRTEDHITDSTLNVNSAGVKVMFIFKRLYNNWLLGIATPLTSYYHDVRSMAVVLSILGVGFIILLSVFLIRLSVLKARSDEENKDKTSFLARMSHEIRTPMNSILGMAELINRKAVSSEVQEYISIIAQAGTTLLAIINDILDFSKIESGRLKIEARSYHLSSVINDMINVIRPRAAEKSLDFFVTVDSAIPSELLGDDVRLRQILINLLSNAVKYTKKGFISLSIGMEQLDQRSLRLICTIEDSGIGIRQEDIDRLFYEFSRVDIKANQGIEGTGLGLVITRALCLAMNGDVTVTSVYGNGSTFQAGIIQEFESEKRVAEVIAPERKRVLFYDWRAQYVQSITHAFQGLGIVPVCPPSFPDFMKALEQGDYNYAFISSKYAVECTYVLGKRSAPPQLISMVEPGEVSVFREMNSILMPVYSITLANILNDVTRGIPSHNTKLKIRFTAPSAKVLIVDDISTNLRVAKELIAPYNMNIHTCLSGPEAIELIKNNHYDVVFMDHMMPGMDGLEATSFIRAMDTGDGFCQNLPIIALTANAVFGQKEMFLEKGLNDFLAKPIDIQKLNEILEKWLPPEKQIEAAWQEEAKPGKMENIVIAGMNIEMGLRNTGGSLAVYLDILSDFCRDTESRSVKIQEALEKKDMKLYITLVHALKGASRSIGATEAGEAAAWLEEAAAREDPLLIQSKTTALLENLRTLTNNIRAVAKQSRAGGKQNDLTALRLDELKKALNEMDIEAVNKILLEYASLSLNSQTRELIAGLEESILMFEYDKAIEKINGLL